MRKKDALIISEFRDLLFTPTQIVVSHEPYAMGIVFNHGTNRNTT